MLQHLPDKWHFYAKKNSQTPYYGLPVYTDISLLRTVCFVPGERKTVHFLHNLTEHFINTNAFYGLFSVHINWVWLENQRNYMKILQHVHFHTEQGKQNYFCSQSWASKLPLSHHMFTKHCTFNDITHRTW